MNLWRWLESKYKLARGIGGRLIINGDFIRLYNITPTDDASSQLSEYLLKLQSKKVHKITIEWRKGK